MGNSLVINLDDAELVELSWGDPAAFAGLFDRHFVAVYRFCVRRTNQTAAEDLAGETFRRAFESRHRYEVQHRDAKPWLLGIASNLIRNYYRNENRRVRAYSALSGQMANSVSDAAWSIAAQLDARADLAVVAAGLKSLPTEEVDALTMYVWEELSYAQIAEVQGVPVGTIRSRLNRVRGRIRELLAENGESTGGASTKIPGGTS